MLVVSMSWTTTLSVISRQIEPRANPNSLMIAATESANVGDQLHRRHVHTEHGAEPDALRTPAGELRARRAHHPATQFPCQVDGFGDGDERRGRYQPPGGVCQRTSASAASTSPVRMSTSGR